MTFGPIPAMLLAAAVLCGVAVWITRTTWRRLAGALVGTIVGIFYVVCLDAAALQLGCWHYPYGAGSVAPPSWYAITVFWPGLPLTLVGWRAIRRFGGRGLLGFLIAIGLYGVTRDWITAASTGIIVFGPGLLPLILDAVLGWAGGAAVAQGLMWLVAGRARSDPLARVTA